MDTLEMEGQATGLRTQWKQVIQNQGEHVRNPHFESSQEHWKSKLDAHVRRVGGGDERKGRRRRRSDDGDVEERANPDEMIVKDDMLMGKCEREPNKRKDGTFHDDVYDAPLHTNKHSTSWRFDLVSPSRLDHPSGSRQDTHVHWGRHDGRPWVAQPHEHAHAAQVTDTSVEHGWRPRKPGSGVKV